VGLERDSPRSVVLTLCGAWGALKAPKEGEDEEDEAYRFSKFDLLLYRRPNKKTNKNGKVGNCPAELKTLRVEYWNWNWNWK